MIIHQHQTSRFSLCVNGRGETFNTQSLYAYSDEINDLVVQIVLILLTTTMETLITTEYINQTTMVSVTVWAKPPQFVRTVQRSTFWHRSLAL